MKKSISIFLIIMLILLSGCGSNSVEQQIIGNTYIYEKTGFGGDFYIKINKDKTFEFYEGALSSYIGYGNWKLDGNTLILEHSQENNYKNCFKIKDNELVFQEENSNNFTYIKVLDGEKFVK